jgi:hypothetical protein
VIFGVRLGGRPTPHRFARRFARVKRINGQRLMRAGVVTSRPEVEHVARDLGRIYVVERMLDNRVVFGIYVR